LIYTISENDLKYR